MVRWQSNKILMVVRKRRNIYNVKGLGRLRGSSVRLAQRIEKILNSQLVDAVRRASLKSIRGHKLPPATQRKAAAGGGGRAGGSSNILQFYTDDSPGLQVGPTTVLVASLSFVGVVVLLHIWGKFRM
eukprot:scaffold35634_cov222-Skeletonema_dohrnii-CCMP3373.AAC.3